MVAERDGVEMSPSAHPPRATVPNLSLGCRVGHRVVQCPEPGCQAARTAGFLC